MLGRQTITAAKSRSRFMAFIGLILLATLQWPSIARADQGWTSGWPEEQPSDVISALLAHVTEPAVAYAATSEGIYRTANGGATWHVLTGSLSNALALSASRSAPKTAYAYASATDSTSRATLRRSDDGGSVWRDPAAGRTTDSLAGLSVLLVDRGNANTVLVGVGKVGDGYGRIMKSSDGGATWHQTYSVQTTFGIGQITAIAQAASDRKILYAGHSVYHGGSLLRSSDGGESWATWPMPPDTALYYPAALAVAVDDPQRVYVALQAPVGGGVLVFTTNDGGLAWERISAGLPSAKASAPVLQPDPANPSRIFIGLSGDGAGVYVSGDRGRSWSLAGRTTLGGRSITKLAINASGSQLYAGTPGGAWQLNVDSTAAGVDPRFAGYYASHDGLRVLGRPITGLTVTSGFASQYFEKGRIEDRAAETSAATWRFTYGLLVDEMQQRAVALPVGGDVSTMHYSDIGRLAAANLRLPVPSGLASGTTRNADGSVFVPFSADLRPEAGHNVSGRFWQYMNRADLFPGGWLHDIGLPIAEPVRAVVDKGDVRGRAITVQAFQRAVLTDDPLNPPEWQIERANVGSDYLQAVGEP